MKTLIIIVIALPILYLCGVLIYGSATKFIPLETTSLDRINTRPPFMIQDTSFSILTWNIGYAGLGKESDFFYDGGKQVRPSEETVRKNFSGIAKVLEENQADFLCLQEVDFNSKRSYGMNQSELLAEGLTMYEYIEAINYKVKFVPVPFLKPLGKVNAGLVTFSQLPSTYPERISYTSKHGWPNSLFMLSRCFSKVHIPLTRGKDLIIINTHNSAYDTSGNMKKVEFDKLMTYAQELYSNGHYVVVAGDWNQCPPQYTTKGEEVKYRERKFSSDFLPQGWNWSSDNSSPTNRKTNTVYNPETSYTTVVDFFLVSPNVKIDMVETMDLGFEFSDHNPVRMKFSLRSE